MISDKIKLSLRGIPAILLVLTAGCTSVPPSQSDQHDAEKGIEAAALEENRASQLFAPTFIPEKDAYHSAFSIYKSSAEKPTGVHTRYGVVFVIVNIDQKKEKLRYVKGTAMLRAKLLLQQKYQLPANFKLTCRELEARDYRKQGIYRYSLAYRESDVVELSKTTATQ